MPTTGRMHDPASRGLDGAAACGIEVGLPPDNSGH
jgi:hypothetical protein